jgi:hypothetical protein
VELRRALLDLVPEPERKRALWAFVPKNLICLAVIRRRPAFLRPGLATVRYRVVSAMN